MARRLVGIALAAVLLPGCAGDPAPQPPAAPTRPAGSATWPPGIAVLEIVVQEGEQCPHIPRTPDPRCDPVPLPDTAVAVLAPDDRVVATTRSGGDGRASVSVAPGAYLVRAEKLARFRIRPEQPVTAIAGRSVRVVLTYGNGIQ